MKTVRHPFTNLACACAALGAAAVLNLAAASEALAARYCLLVAIDDYPGADNDLSFPKSDARNFANYLMSDHGFTEKEFYVLADQNATTQNILGAIHGIAGQLKPDDTFVFYYSGHGTQVPDFDGDERDGLDEALVSYDHNGEDPATWVSDDHLRAALATVSAERTLVITDCCHSGTITRTSGTPAKRGIKMWTPVFHPGPPEPTRGQRPAAMRNITRSDMNHTLISGCSATEYSYEHSDVGGGLLTMGIIQASQEGGASLPIAQFQTAVSKKVQGWVDTKLTPPAAQTPQFEGKLTLSLKEILGEKAPGSEPIQLEIVTPPAVQPLAAEAKEVILSVATDKQEYTAGEFMSVSVNADRDCYLRIYYTDQDGLSYQIFPNKFQQEDRVKGGAAVTVPGEGANFRFGLTFPDNFGGDRVGETITAVASTQPFSDSGRTDWGQSTIVEIPGASRGALLARGIRVEQKPGVATAAYTIKKKQ